MLAGTLVVRGAQAAPGQSPHDGAPAPPVLSPEGWSERVHARCRQDAVATDEADAGLRAVLASGPVTREQASFPARETAARETSRRNALRGAVSRLTTVLFGPGGPSGVSGDDQDAPRRLFRTSSACAVDAVEATLLLAIFGVPFTEASAAAVAVDGPFPVVEARFRALVAEGASLAATFAAMRPDGPWRAHLEAATRDALAPPGSCAPPRRSTSARNGSSPGSSTSWPRPTSRCASSSISTPRSMPSKARSASSCPTT